MFVSQLVFEIHLILRPHILGRVLPPSQAIEYGMSLCWSACFISLITVFGSQDFGRTPRKPRKEAVSLPSFGVVHVRLAPKAATLPPCGKHLSEKRVTQEEGGTRDVERETESL